MKRPQPHQPHRRGTFHCRLQPLYTENTRFRAPSSSPKHSPCNIHAAIPMRSCNQKFKNRIELRTQEQPLVAKHIGRTMKRTQPHPPHRRGTFLRHIQRHFTRKNTRFHAPASSPKHNHATFMQPFQCDLQQQLQEPHRTTHTGTTNRCKTHRRNNSRMKRSQPHPPHRQGTFLRHMQTLYTEKHTISCPGFLPKHYPCNIHAAIPMRLCNQRFKNRIELRTQTGTTTRCKTHRRNN